MRRNASFTLPHATDQWVERRYAVQFRHISEVFTEKVVPDADQHTTGFVRVQRPILQDDVFLDIYEGCCFLFSELFSFFLRIFPVFSGTFAFFACRHFLEI